MSVYKQVKKSMLKELTKEQKKRYKDNVQDVADEMLKAYTESIRLNDLKGFKGKSCVGMYMPIPDTRFGLRVYIEIDGD